MRRPRPERARDTPFKWRKGASKPKKFRGLTDILKLFHSLPYWKRQGVSIPPWYFEEFKVPRWMLTKRPSSLSYSKRCRASLARLFYLWYFEIGPVYEMVPLGTHQRVLFAKCDGLFPLFQRVLHARYWHSAAEKLLENLKVLLTPSQGWHQID